MGAMRGKRARKTELGRGSGVCRLLLLGEEVVSCSTQRQAWKRMRRVGIRKGEL